MANKSITRNIILFGLLAALVVLIAIKLFFVANYRIPQNGMYPGLPAGSQAFASRRAYSNPSEVKRGDIIIYERTEDGQKYTYVWRVIGLPGEKVEARGQKLSINDNPVERQHLREVDGKQIFREQIGDVNYEVAFTTSVKEMPPDVSLTVPAGEFFVMGDNRFDAQDSRYTGTVPFSAIIGKKL